MNRRKPSNRGDMNVDRETTKSQAGNTVDNVVAYFSAASRVAH